MRSWRLSLPLLALAALSVPSSADNGALERASEQSVRAVFLFNLLKFTELSPKTGSGQIRLCVATNDPELVVAMDAINERQVHGKTVSTIRFRSQPDCDVIYVDTRQRWNSLAEKVASQSALTVGGYRGFVGDGGIVEIYVVDNKVRFSINLTVARRAGVRFYPQLLQLARPLVE